MQTIAHRFDKDTGYLPGVGDVRNLLINLLIVTAARCYCRFSVGMGETMDGHGAWRGVIVEPAGNL